MFGFCRHCSSPDEVAVEVIEDHYVVHTTRRWYEEFSRLVSENFASDCFTIGVSPYTARTHVTAVATKNSKHACYTTCFKLKKSLTNVIFSNIFESVIFNLVRSHICSLKNVISKVLQYFLRKKSQKMTPRCN